MENEKQVSVGMRKRIEKCLDFADKILSIKEVGLTKEASGSDKIKYQVEYSKDGKEYRSEFIQRGWRIY